MNALSLAAPARLADAFVFPGQGSQYPGMGRDLGWCDPDARHAVLEAQEITGLPVEELMTRADAATIADPEIAQLLVFVHSSVLARQLRKAGQEPAVVAGHSLGEYTALVAAGSLTQHDALRLVAARGAAMAAAASVRRGTMGAVVGLDPDEVQRLCDQNPRANVANINSPRQTVVSGDECAVDAVLSAAGEAGALRTKRLPVGGAYHSPLMAPAEAELAPLLRSVPLREPRVPLVSSVTGEPVVDIEAHRERLLGQVTATVRWRQTIETVATTAVRRFVEVGPGRVLTGLGREMVRQAEHRSAVEAARSPAPTPPASTQVVGRAAP